MPAAEDGCPRKDRIRGRAGTPLFPNRVNHRDDDPLRQILIRPACIPGATHLGVRNPAT